MRKVGAWFVVTWRGEKVAGPFSTVEECYEVAKFMSARYANVSPTCRYLN